MTYPYHSTDPVPADEAYWQVRMANDDAYNAAMSAWAVGRLLKRHDPELTQTRGRSRKTRRGGEHIEPPVNALRTPREAAARLRCSVKTLHEHVAAGRLRYVAIGQGRKRPRKMFTDSDLDAFIENSTRKEVNCLSTRTTSGPVSTATISKSTVIAFSARPKRQPNVKPKR
jgi:excisionase family DNA binding protein